MSQPSKIINSLAIEVKNTNVTIGIYIIPQISMKKRHVEHLPEDLQQQLQLPAETYVWLSSLCDENSINYSLNLNDNHSLAAWYYSDSAFRVLSKQCNLQQLNFTHDWIYWFRNNYRYKEPQVCFEKFSLQFRAYYNNNNELYLQCNVVDEGDSYILNLSLDKLVQRNNFDTQLLGKVVYQKRLINYHHLSSDERNDSGNIYPIINHNLAAFLDIEMEHVKHEHKMQHSYQRITDIKNTYLNSDDFIALVPHNKTWMPANPPELIKNTRPQYCFGNNTKTNNIQLGLKNHGPYKQPNNSHTQLFFIYPEQCKDLKEQLENHLKGTNGYTQINTYTHLNACYKENRNLVISSPEQAIREIKEHLEQPPVIDKGRYFVFYISPYSKYDSERDHKTLYYTIKEILLHKNIPSQVIDYKKAQGQNLNYWIPNIASAMITKLGGTSWLLDKSDIKELVIGFGASRCQEDDELYIGSAFCFDNKGVFKDFKCWPKSEHWALVGQLKSAIKDFYAVHKSINRIIIHYFKNTFTPSTLAYKTSKIHQLFINGSYIHTHHHQYLLYINGYSSPNVNPTKGPFPLKLSLQSNRINYVTSKNVVSDIMQQLHDFTHLHWRSLAQPRTPVTIAYPQYLARLSPNFQSQLMVNNTIKGLWFL